jgi:hypothetical protein
MTSGYVLALILEACLQYQSSRAHVDPLHVTAHFLRTTSVDSFKIHVCTLKIGNGFTNLTAELVQEVCDCESDVYLKADKKYRTLSRSLRT